MIRSLLCAAALSGCHGGKSQSPTTAVLTLSTKGSVAAQSIRGVELTITLPDGVTLSADSEGRPNDGVLAAAGAAAGGAVAVAGHYTAATSSTRGTVTLVLVKTAGFDAGEFATVTCTLAKEATPGAADFGQAGFKAVDQNGAPMDGLEVSSSVATR
jgi:hypothetical protein